MPAWRPEAFLASLEPAALPPALTARLSGNAATAAAALYAAFIESPNFEFWFRRRRAPVLHLVEDEVGRGGDVGSKLRGRGWFVGCSACTQFQQAPAGGAAVALLTPSCLGVTKMVVTGSLRHMRQTFLHLCCIAQPQPCILLLPQPESEEEDEGFAKVPPGAGDISDAGVESDPDEVELVQQLLSTEQVG